MALTSDVARVPINLPPAITNNRLSVTIANSPPSASSLAVALSSLSPVAAAQAVEQAKAMARLVQPVNSTTTASSPLVSPSSVWSRTQAQAVFATFGNAHERPDGALTFEELVRGMKLHGIDESYIQRYAPSIIRCHLSIVNVHWPWC
jgi:hypothetical protein